MDRSESRGLRPIGPAILKAVGTTRKKTPWKDQSIKMAAWIGDPKRLAWVLSAKPDTSVAIQVASARLPSWTRQLLLESFGNVAHYATAVLLAHAAISFPASFVRLASYRVSNLLFSPKAPRDLRVLCPLVARAVDAQLRDPSRTPRCPPEE